MSALLLFIVGLATAAFVLAPLIGGSRELETDTREASAFNTLPQLEIDRALGKIDQAEYEELREKTPGEPSSLPVEALIYAMRRAKRLNTAAEAEILVMRARRKRK